MSGLAPLLAGRERPGVWRWRSESPVATVREVVEAADWQFVVLDTAGVGDRAEFFEAVGAALDLDEAWGRNLDALADSLRDVPTRGARGVVVLWEAWSGLAYGEHPWFEVVLEILAERAGDERLGAFSVLLRGAGPDLAGVSLLD